jgi:hypothetical protein
VILGFEIIVHSEFQIAFCENQSMKEKTYVNIIQTMSNWIVERVVEPHSHTSSGTCQLSFIGGSESSNFFRYLSIFSSKHRHKLLVLF